MKCIECGENNVSTARFCAFCGVKLSVESIPPASSRDAALKDESGASDSRAAYAPRATARPLNDNPYQPYRPAPIFKPREVEPAADRPHAPAASILNRPFIHSSSAERSTADATASVLNQPFVHPEPDEEDLAVQPIAVEPVAPTVPQPATEEDEPDDEDEGFVFEYEEDEYEEDEYEEDEEAAVPYLPTVPVEETVEETEKAPAPEVQPAARETERGKPRVNIKPSANRMFLFEEEEEEEDEDDYVDEYEGIRDFEENGEFDDDEEDDYYDDDEEEPAAGRIFVRVFSVLTVLLLIAGLFAFGYGTSVGRRLRASMGWSSSAEDYMLLADWQLSQHALSDAAASYYNAFKLDQNNYELALRVGTGLENAGDDETADKLYSYLISYHPQKDEPYDRLMALLNRQGKTDTYEALLEYRSLHQPGYQPPVSQISQVLQTPAASHESGAYTAPFTLTLDAGGAEIRYTLDGTTPTAQSLLYTGAITLPRGSWTIRAVSVVNGIISAEWVGNFFIS